MENKLRVGTRKSLLALVQTNIVVERIKKLFPQLEIEVITMTTKGDELLDRSLGSFGGKGVFTKELEDGLLNNYIDIAVHSAKDMPMELPKGLVIGAVLERADTRDVLVTNSGISGKDLPEGSVIGTSSLRRELQIKALNPGVKIENIRGNVQTRLNKLRSGKYDGILLAAAGLTRLDFDKDTEFNYQDFKYEFFEEDVFLPAACQGILAVESRKDSFKEVLDAISSKEAWIMLDAERSFLSQIGGSCNAPAAALSKVLDGRLEMQVMYADNGQDMVKRKGSCGLNEAAALGAWLAKECIER